LQDTKKPIATVGDDEGFVAQAFRLYWEANRIWEPDQYYSFRDAFQKLVDFTGMTRTTIALELGVTTSYLGMIESGKRLGNQYHYSQLKELARSYAIPKLAEFFEGWEDKAMNSQAPTKGRKVKRGVGNAGPDWRDMMGE
jgi:transcriptional regulator with XRE-family HTH domain